MIKISFDSEGNGITTVVLGNGDIGLGIIYERTEFSGIALSELKKKHKPGEQIQYDEPTSGNKVHIQFNNVDSINYLRNLLDKAEECLTKEQKVNYIE